MMDGEVQRARRLCLVNWALLLTLLQLLLLCLLLTSFTLEIEHVLLQVVATSSFFTAAGYWGLSRKWAIRPAFVLIAIAQLELLFLLAVPLTYVTASANLPLQDANLAFVDRMTGLDWPAYHRFVCDHPSLVPYVLLGYAMITWPTIGVPVVLGLTGHFRRLQQFALAVALSVIVTGTISSLLPAIGTYRQYGIEPDTAALKASGYLVQLQILPFVRDGSLRILNVENLGGIITFPSFHASAAVLSLWAFWGVWWMRPLALIANIAMLLATPLVGGHYFIDVFAGIGLAVLAIAVAQAIDEKFSRPAHRLVASPIERIA
jgi:membrane-associated phospholipid phosphatase